MTMVLSFIEELYFRGKVSKGRARREFVIKLAANIVGTRQEDARTKAANFIFIR